MNIVVTGGAGFIGSNLVDRLMKNKHHVTVVDSLVGGRKEFIADHLPSQRFRFAKLDIRNTTGLKRILSPKIDVVFHLAANADIARGVNDPRLDFEQSLVATFSLLQAMRHHSIKKIVYTSGSGVYGDRGAHYSRESYGPLQPVSMYGATKLGAEGLISAFAHLYDMHAWMLRPANIIGPRVTHGVVFDFVRRLKRDPSHLHILGNGEQSKAYLHVHDVVDALWLVFTKAQDRVNIFNLSSNSFIKVNAVADLVVSRMGLQNVKKSWSGGTVGWKGDVAIVRLHNTAIKKLGWKSHYTSRQATIATIDTLLTDPRITQLTSQHDD